MKPILTTVQQNTIRQHAAEAEKLGKLHPAVLELIYEEKWFQLFVPKAFGGPGKKLPEILRLEEELAALDGSLAWTVTLCSGASWFAGFVATDLVNEFFADPQVCLAGSGAVGGIAVETDGGYLINGDWKYASGALHATVFTANCYLKTANGDDVLDEDNQPVIKSFLLKKEEVNVLPGWSYFGLVATGSHAFEVNELNVPANRSFKINANLHEDEVVFDYPFLQLAETTLAVNSAGLCQHFLALTEEMFYARSGQKRYTEKQLVYFNHLFVDSQREFELARLKFYENFDASWNALVKNGVIDQDLLNKVSSASRTLAHTARNVCSILFPYCGLAAAKTDTTINRVWRDLHTASQHSLLTFEN